MTKRPCWTGKRVLPDSVVKKLDDAIHKIMADKEFQAKAKGTDLQIGYENPETFQESIMRTKNSLLTFVKEERLVKK
jgi:tripartite-type tricarboxylate transporter receptor subunit TctC